MPLDRVGRCRDGQVWMAYGARGTSSGRLGHSCLREPGGRALPSPFQLCLLPFSPATPSGWSLPQTLWSLQLLGTYSGVAGEASRTQELLCGAWSPTSRRQLMRRPGGLGPVPTLVLHWHFLVFLASQFPGFLDYRESPQLCHSFRQGASVDGHGPRRVCELRRHRDKVSGSRSLSRAPESPSPLRVCVEQRERGPRKGPSLPCPLTQLCPF